VQIRNTTKKMGTCQEKGDRGENPIEKEKKVGYHSRRKKYSSGAAPEKVN